MKTINLPTQKAQQTLKKINIKENNIKAYHDQIVQSP